MIARTQGGQAAKDAMGAAVTTTGVVSALMLTFTFPGLLSPPASVTGDVSGAAGSRRHGRRCHLNLLRLVCLGICVRAACCGGASMWHAAALPSAEC